MHLCRRLHSWRWTGDAGELADLLVLADLLGENDPLFAG